MYRVISLLAGLAFLGACSSSSSSPPASGAPAGGDAGADAAETTRGDYDPAPFGGPRPVQLYVPSGYRDDTPAPLLVLLHGYSASGILQDVYLGMRALAESHGYLYAHPDGTVDSRGNHFWNATDGCCDLDRTGVDDSSYLLGLISEIKGRYRVDPRRVYFVGHSNGGFMSYRMACDHADVIAAIGSIAGATWLDTSKCKPSAPVAVLEIHGTKDETISYDGSTYYPGAKTTVADWATYDGCADTIDSSAAPIDIDDTTAGPETTITKYVSGCRPGGHAELWSIAGGAHVPAFNHAFGAALFDWLAAHPKASPAGP